jgi:hypothetical protein
MDGQHGSISDGLMLTNVLQNHPKGAVVQLLTDGSRIGNKKISISSVVINHGTVFWENKTHIEGYCEMYHTKISTIMHGLRYLVTM